MHGGEIGDRIVTMIVQHIDDEGQLAGMAQRIGREFVQAVAIDVAFTIRVPAPTGLRVMKAAGTGAVVRMGFGAIVAGAAFVTVGVGPGDEMRAIARDRQVGEIDQASGDRGGDEDRVEDFFERALIGGQDAQIGGPLPQDDWPGGARQEPLG